MAPKTAQTQNPDFPNFVPDVFERVGHRRNERAAWAKGGLPCGGRVGEVVDSAQPIAWAVRLSVHAVVLCKKKGTRKAKQNSPTHKISKRRLSLIANPLV